MTKIGSVAVACGLAGLIALGAVTIGRAQQAEPKGEAGVSPKKTLRDRVVKLRTEIDLQQLEFDAARSYLLDRMKAAQGVGEPNHIGTAVNGVREQAFLAAAMGDEEAAKSFEQGKDAIEKLAKKRSDEFRAHYDRKLDQFARLASALNEKKLDLEEAENRYRQIR
jgi:hypothetical protein